MQQRPTRIVVFGVLCLIIGGLLGIQNLAEAGLSFLGPERLQKLMQMMQEMGQEMGQPMPKWQKDNFQVQAAVLAEPVYRIGQGVESTGSVVMAGLLIAAGIGLLRGHAWSLKLSRWWAWYAIPAAGVSVVLQMQYVLPQMPDAPRGGEMFGAATSLLSLWVFPILVLRHLPSQAVRDYLNQPQPQAHPAPAVQQAATTYTPPPTPSSTSTTSRPADSTWRDDPWNS